MCETTIYPGRTPHLYGKYRQNISRENVISAASHRCVPTMLFAYHDCRTDFEMNENRAGSPPILSFFI